MLNMGKQISKYEYQKYGSDGVMKPIIFCCPDEELARKGISLNVSIAEKLISVKPIRRSFIGKACGRNNRVSVFMIYAMMLIGDSGYYSFAELSNAVFFYPFEYQIEKELILGDSRFSTNNFGGELSVSVNV